MISPEILSPHIKDHSTGFNDYAMLVNALPTPQKGQSVDTTPFTAGKVKKINLQLQIVPDESSDNS